jgi:hypothetical protein
MGWRGLQRCGEAGFGFSGFGLRPNRKEDLFLLRGSLKNIPEARRNSNRWKPEPING